jgi:[acyl-carrier-protein] S-malonyltransferase
VGRVGGALVSRIAFLFPGQGSQMPGMGRALAEAFPESRAVFDEASAALGWDLARTCFEGSADELARTETTQPAVLTVSVAALRALERQGLRPTAAAGHSLGEYTAHVAAGTIRFVDSVRCVRERGRFMQEAVPVGVGAMAAILGLDLAVVEEVCRASAQDQIVSPANRNGPDQIVIAGHREAVERAAEAALSRGAKRAVALPVSAPFHCALMTDAGRRLAGVLERIELSDPAFPVYGNADARPIVDRTRVRDALVRQVASPVRWHELVLAMIHDGIDTFVEVGPGRVLAGLVRRIDRRVRVYGVEDPSGVAEVAEILGAAA